MDNAWIYGLLSALLLLSASRIMGGLALGIGTRVSRGCTSLGGLVATLACIGAGTLTAPPLRRALDSRRAHI